MGCTPSVVSRLNREQHGTLQGEGENTREPQQAPDSASSQDDTFWTSNRRATFKAVIKCGVKATWALCQEYKDTLPFPGGIGVALIGHIAELVSQALANKDNLEALMDRAAELMDVIIEKHARQEDLANANGELSVSKFGSRLFRSLMERLRDLLEVILQYTKDYCDRNFILKFLMTSHDRDQYNGLVDALAELMADAHFSVSVDTHSMTAEVHKDVKQMQLRMQMLESVRSQTQYVDHTVEVKRVVASLGGIRSVLSCEAKIEQVAMHLDAGQQVTLAVLRNQVQAGFLAAAAQEDLGVHTIIRHTDMRTFWRQFFHGLQKVDWDVWWCAWPSRLVEVIQDKEMVDELKVRLSHPSDMERFYNYVEKREPQTISVREVEQAFPLGVSLLDVVDHALGIELGQEPDLETPGKGRAASRAASHKISLHSGHLSRSHTRGKEMARCQLPELDPLYVGRDKDAGALVQIFKQQLGNKSHPCSAAVCVVAGPGMGKSSLSIDVGWQMAEAGLCPAGAIMVDFREASSFDVVLGRLCSVLDVPKDEHATNNIHARLVSCQQSWEGPLLLVLDNAEDPMHGSGGAQLADFFVEIAREAVLLITSRIPVAASAGVHQYQLGSIDASASQTLMQSTAPNLESAEMLASTEICSGVPLLVRRAGDSLRNGQIAVQDLKDAVGAECDHTLAVKILYLTLCTLPRQQKLQLARLAVFPSAFTDGGAAAVLEQDEAQAHALLGVFLRHGLVMRDSNTNQYSLHMAVRGAAAATGGAANALQSQTNFIAFVFQQLEQWTHLFFSSAWELPLSLAREAGPDILSAFELVGSLTARQAGPPPNMLHAILAVDATLMQALLLCAGYHQGTWSKLQHLHESCEGGPSEQTAAALLLKCMADADYEAAAKAHLYCHAFGSDHPRSIACVHVMAEGRRRQHRYSDAEALFREAYEARLRVLGECAPATWISLQGLATCVGHDQKLPAKAEPLWQELLRMLHSALGQGHHPQILAASDNLARTLLDQGKLAAAEAIYSKAVAAKQIVLGPDHPDTLLAINRWATSLQKLGRSADAERMYQCALASHLRVLGPSHPNTVDTLNCFATCLKRQGKLGAAEVMYQDALASRQAALGPEHPETLISMNNLAGILKEKGNLSGAEAMYREVLAARQRVLGNGHPRALISANCLALTLHSQGKLSAAELMYRDVLQRRLNVLGPLHPDTLTSMNILAGCLKDQGKVDVAEAMYRDALASRLQLYGPDHTSTLASLNCIANCLKDQGKLEGAEAVYRDAWARRGRILGSTHPETIMVQNNLAICLKEQGKLDAAEVMLLDVLGVRSSLLGPEHPSTLITLNCLATVMKGQGKLADAETMYRDLVAVRQRVLGSDHPSTLTSLAALAECLGEQGNLEAAGSMHQQVLNIRQQLLGQDHPKTNSTRSSLASVYWDSGRADKALPLYQELWSGD